MAPLFTGLKLGFGSGGVPIKATGGTVTTAAGKTIHTFTASGTFEVISSSLSSVDYLVVAGGGGGSPASTGAQTYGAGGGGAGGLRSTVTNTGGGGTLETALSVSPGSYVVTVGGGGAGGTISPPTAPVNGSPSVFSTITSTGGGGAQYDSNVKAPTGGSGGGEVGVNNPGNFYGDGTSNQGYRGGSS